MAAADFIKECNGRDGMHITAESCFSPLRAYMEGPDPKRNGNRGIERGCEAGRSFMALHAEGSFVPCLHIKPGDASQCDLLPGDGCIGKVTALADYWEQSPALQALRENSENRERCAGCCYERRCLPCPVCEAESVRRCPLAETVQAQKAVEGIPD